VAKGETVAIVGESGSGKSVTSYAVMRILDRAGKIAGGSIIFGGVDIGKASDKAMRDMRGREISMVFQNPRAALNPIRKVGRQIEDVLRQHALAGADDAKAMAIDILTKVRIANPDERYHAYPFELSGGMCQRVVIALALACRPQLLIADEPTTGLDVMTQKTVMDLITELTRERSMSTILITHDLGLAAAYCDRVVVMEKGNVVETASSRTIFKAPAHAYTRKLMRATPRIGASLADLLPEGANGATRPKKTNGATVPVDSGRNEPLLLVENLVKEYPRKNGARSWMNLASVGVLYHGLELMGGGAILTGLVLGAIGVFIIEKDFMRAAAFALAGAVLTYFGFMHGEAVGIGGGLGVTPSITLGYLMVAGVLIACDRFLRQSQYAPQTEPIATQTAPAE
jgi:peptide/nickel transport system ATP-binding protein